MLIKSPQDFSNRCYGAQGKEEGRSPNEFCSLWCHKALSYFIRIDLGHHFSSEKHIVTIVTIVIYYWSAFILHLILKVIWQPILTIIGFVFSKSKTIILSLSERAGSIYVIIFFLRKLHFLFAPFLTPASWQQIKNWHSVVWKLPKSSS